MAWIVTGLCWSRHLTDPLWPYKGCQGSGGDSCTCQQKEETRRRNNYMKKTKLKEATCLSTCRYQRVIDKRFKCTDQLKLCLNWQATLALVPLCLTHRVRTELFFSKERLFKNQSTNFRILFVYSLSTKPQLNIGALMCISWIFSVERKLVFSLLAMKI